MAKPIPDQRIEFPLAGGETFVLVTGEQSLFEEITTDLIEKAERALALMRKHVTEDYVNEEFRRKWTATPIPGVEGNLLGALLWVIGHERERMFAEMTKHKKGDPCADRSPRPHHHGNDPLPRCEAAA